MKKQNEFEWIVPLAIAFCGIIVGATRWILGFLAADGMSLPASIGEQFHWISGGAGLFMAIVDGAAVAYIMYVVGYVKSNARWALIALTVAMVVVFVIFLEPVVASRANKAEVFDIIADWNMRTVWAIAAVLAPFLTTASVMFAQAVYSTARDRTNAEIVQLTEWNRQWQLRCAELEKQVQPDIAKASAGYLQFVADTASRNGSGIASAAEVMQTYAVSQRTAYGWIAKYKKEKV
jgi:hypothetical protein